MLTVTSPPSPCPSLQLPKREKNDLMDSNTITPGTPFMDRLAIALQYYVHLRLNNDPGWKGVEVRAAKGSYGGVKGLSKDQAGDDEGFLVVGTRCSCSGGHCSHSARKGRLDEQARMLPLQLRLGQGTWLDGRRG